jgi:polysaccharide biosynthesis transport protein
VDVQVGLHVLPLVERSSEAPSSISAPSLDGVLGRAKGTYDFVIVDMPALAAGPDVRAAAQSLDGFLLVVKWGVTASELVRQALQSAGEARPRFIGAVLNMADEKTMKRYGDELPAEWKFSIAS